MLPFMQKCAKTPLKFGLIGTVFLNFGSTLFSLGAPFVILPLEPDVWNEDVETPTN